MALKSNQSEHDSSFKSQFIQKGWNHYKSQKCKKKMFFWSQGGGKDQSIQLHLQTVIWLSHKSSSTCPQAVKERRILQQDLTDSKNPP